MKNSNGLDENSRRLAIEGGNPGIIAPLPTWPLFEPDEIEAVSAVLRSGRVNYWTGNLCRDFERAFSEFVGTQYGVAVANGTLALELAFRALGVGSGDDVVTTPRSFYATITSILAVGARPVFADVDRDSGNLTPETVEAALTTRTKAIVAVHIGGWPCDMRALRALAESLGLLLIEDCAQAHGGMIGGRMVGSWGHAAAFSFCQDKIVTTGGEGGMLLLSDEETWKRAWSYKDHGKSHEALCQHEFAPGYRWLHVGEGSNWRMTEMQAAIGLCQLRKLPDWLHARRKNAQHMLSRFCNLPNLRVPRPNPDTLHAYYRVYTYVRPETLAPNWTRDRIIDAIMAEGVPCQVGSCPELYLEAGVRNRGLAPSERLPIAKELGETSLSFLCHPNLNEETIEATCCVVAKVFNSASTHPLSLRSH